MHSCRQQEQLFDVWRLGRQQAAVSACRCSAMVSSHTVVACRKHSRINTISLQACAACHALYTIRTANKLQLHPAAPRR